MPVSVLWVAFLTVSCAIALMLAPQANSALVFRLTGDGLQGFSAAQREQR